MCPVPQFCVGEYRICDSDKILLSSAEKYALNGDKSSRNCIERVLVLYASRLLPLRLVGLHRSRSTAGHET